MILLSQPLPRLWRVGSIKISNHRFRKWLVERRHHVLPLFVPDYREPFDIGKVLNVELDFVPQRASFPAMEIRQFEQEAQLSVLPDEPIEFGYTALIISFGQLPGDANGD